MLDDDDSISGRGKRLCCSSKCLGQFVGPTKPSVRLVQGALLLVKWAGHEVDHSFPSSAEVKKMWSCASTLPVYFHFFVKRNTFTFTNLVIEQRIFKGN
jgi:hypothetical protein